MTELVPVLSTERNHSASNQNCPQRCPFLHSVATHCIGANHIMVSLKNPCMLQYNLFDSDTSPLFGAIFGFPLMFLSPSLLFSSLCPCLPFICCSYTGSSMTRIPPNFRTLVMLANASLTHKGCKELTDLIFFPSPSLLLVLFLGSFVFPCPSRLQLHWSQNDK